MAGPDGQVATALHDWDNVRYSGSGLIDNKVIMGYINWWPSRHHDIMGYINWWPSRHQDIMGYMNTVMARKSAGSQKSAWPERAPGGNLPYK